MNKENNFHMFNGQFCWILNFQGGNDYFSALSKTIV